MSLVTLTQAVDVWSVESLLLVDMFPLHQCQVTRSPLLAKFPAQVAQQLSTT